MGVEVNVSGPVFDGRAEAAAHEFAHEAEHKIAERGVQFVRSALGGVLRHPTGRYEGAIHVQGNNTVTDLPIVYGPWLEGVGSRNRAGRFAGYFTFRRTTQRVQADAVPTAEELLRAKYLRRMN